MPTELEAKMKVSDLAIVRAKLIELGAKPIVARKEVNTFFDDSKQSLLARDAGLRVRLNANDDGSREIVMTYKGKQVDGPLGAGGLKNREEIEVVVDDDIGQLELLLSRLGFSKHLSFEKRRESFSIDDCRVELDTLPAPLGTFVEIEGPSSASIEAVRKKLGLNSLPLITQGYASMIDEHLKNSDATELLF